MAKLQALLGVLLFVLARLALAEEIVLNEQSHVKCEGMYSKKAWGGSVEPYILTKFLHLEEEEGGPEDPVVAFVLFDWRDQELIGARPDPESGERTLVCDQIAIQGNLCPQEDYGKFIIPENATYIRTEAVHLKSQTPPAPINYPIERTGYYCIDTQPMTPDIRFTAVSEFRNAYGELPGAQVAKLPFYGGLSIVYAVIGIFWGFRYYMNRSDILTVQNYITVTIAFLVVEMVVTWGYYDFINRHGFTTGAKGYMIVVSILNAGRNSISFFLLLIVCMGYGVVKPSLGKTMVYVRWLAAVHFLFGVVYAVGSLTIKPEDAGPLVLLVVLPLAGSGTAFYVWTLNSLSATMKDLIDRKQRVKATMYRRLWWCILSSVLIIFLFFFVNVIVFTGTTTDFAPDHWQTRWFVLDGWLNLVYLGDVAFICYLWRPTENNRRFAMSDELAQDDEGFEIASVGRDSLDMDDEEGLPGNSNANGHGKQHQQDRGASPLPAPQPQRPAKVPRESLDGETIFAVGDDKLSDDGDDEERRGLTSRH